MSALLAIYTRTEQPALKRQRMAWSEVRIDGVFAYYREDRNTDWIRTGPDGRFSGDDQLASVLAGVGKNELLCCALVEMKNRESVSEAVARGLRSDDLRIGAGRPHAP